MILKLFFMQTSYFILKNSFVSSYVIFAANIDDFKSIASKIIPSQLAETLADSFNPKISYSPDRNHEENDDNSDYDSQREETNDRTEDVDYSNAQKIYLKAKDESSKKYVINHQSVDLDDLVEHVKEKLQAEYKTASKVEIEDSVETTESSKRIEDYYYKDETLNEVYNARQKPEPIEKIPEGLTYNIRSPTYPSSYEEVKTQYNDPYKNTDNSENYAQGTVKNKGYLKEKGSVKIREHKKSSTRYVNTYNNKNIKDGKYAKEDSEFDEYNAKDSIEINGKEQEDASYADNITEGENAPAMIGEFKQIDMLKSNDSYEDYVTPKRDNIFDSNEAVTEKSFKQIHHLVSVQKFAADNNKHNIKAVPDTETIKLEKQRDYNENPSREIVVSMKSTRRREVKARTDSIWFKDPKIESYDEFTEKIKENTNKVVTKRMQTMYPTRAHVKFSSPNYLAKLPVVAEQYNFDEPLPEKDREPEKIKYIENPPATINKKIKM